MNEKSDKLLEEFLGEVSFDVLSMIGCIDGLIENGLTQLELNEEQKQLLEDIAECTKTLLQSHDQLEKATG